MLFDNILESIGHTPIVKLKQEDVEAAEVYVKIESRNPSGSVKDRPVYYILKHLMAEDLLKKGGTIIEPTSGNTGVGLAMAGAGLGLNVILVMPDTMSQERRKLMTAFGAELVLTPGSGGMQAALDKADELAQEKDAPIFGQFVQEANVQAHIETTGPEILEDLPDVDGFVAGVGTAGTVSGVGQVLKDHNKDIVVWAVEPADSPILSKGEDHAGGHKIQGIGANFLPDLFNRQVVDDIYLVENEEAMASARHLAQYNGILAGVSSGANVVAARALAKDLGAGHKVVTVLPDTGERYLSQGLFERE